MNAARDYVSQLADTGDSSVGVRVDALNKGLERLTTVLADKGELLDGLSERLGALEQMRSQLEDLKRVYSTFPVMRLLTQVHGASLGEAGRGLTWFGDNIHTETTRGAEVVELLRQKFQVQAQRMANAAEASQKLEEQFRTTLERASFSLGATTRELVQIAQEEQRALAAMEGRRQALSDNTSALVASMQFQDAFRQRVEHVEHALDQLATLAERRVLAGFQDGQPLTDEEAVAAALALYRIVGEQVASLAGDLGAELGRLHDSLSGLTEAAGRLAKDFASALEGPLHGDALSALLRLLNHYRDELAAVVEGSRSRSQVGSEVAGALRELRADLGSLEEVGHAIFLLAINAVVIAAPLGDRGAAVEEIAKQIRVGAADSAACIEQIQGLTKLLDTASDADGAETQPALEDEEAVRVAEGQQEDIVKLSEVLEQRRSLSTALMEATRSAQSGFCATDEDFQSLQTTVATLASARDAWEQALEPLAAAPLDSGVVARVAEYMSAQYTMASERNVQAAALGLATQEDEPSDEEGLDDILF